MSSANSESFTSFFLSAFLLFLFLPWLLWPTLPKLCWIGVVRVGTLALFLILEEMLSIFLPLRIMFAVGLSYMAFIMLRHVPSIPAFWRVFYPKWMLNFVKGFFYWDNDMVFIFQFVNVVYHIEWFADIQESLHPWDKAHLIMMCDLFNMLLDSVCWNFVEDFAFVFISDIGL